MKWSQYKKKHPLKQDTYTRASVEKWRQHAFRLGGQDDSMSRSEKQNAYYWGIVLKIIGDETGYLPEEVHQILGEMFLSYESQGKTFIRSTTSLKTHEFEDHMVKIRRFAATELHCFVPLPNETRFSYEIPKEKVNGNRAARQNGPGNKHPEKENPGS